MSVKKISPDDLNHFIGTDHYYRYWAKIMITDGVKYFCDQVGGYWVIDIILSVYPIIRLEEFVFIELNVDGTKADIVMTDGNDKRLYQQHIEFTDCPDGVWRFYKEGDVILLPSEH